MQCKLNLFHAWQTTLLACMRVRRQCYVYAVCALRPIHRKEGREVCQLIE